MAMVADARFLPSAGEEGRFDSWAAFTSWPREEHMNVANPALAQRMMKLDFAGLGRGTPPGAASGRGPTWTSGSSNSEQWYRRKSRPCQRRLACNLKDLEQEDAACIIHVRRIHKLGFNSPELLENHYRRFGPVKRVFVSNVHDTAADGAPPSYAVRVRPSGIGFVVMERQEDAQKVVAMGEKQVVNNCEILVRRFFARTEYHPESVDAAATPPEADKASSEESCKTDTEPTCSPSLSTISSEGPFRWGDIDFDSE